MFNGAVLPKADRSAEMIFNGAVLLGRTAQPEAASGTQ
jgi:hypothetical protein